MEVIQIRDGVVTLIEETVLRRVGLEAFKDKLAIGLRVQTPVLPRGTVLYAVKDQRSALVLEEPPQVREITHRNHAGRLRTWKIALPWLYFLPVFQGSALEDLSVFFARQSIQRPTDPLFYPALPNTFDDCRVCLGDYRYSITRALASRIADISRYYWESTFNQDATTLYLTKMPVEIVSATPDDAELFQGWTTIPPERVCELSWYPHASLANVLAAVLP